MPSATLPKDADLRQRAEKVVPGGMWGHLNAANLPEGYPQFFASGEGATLVDVDGRRIHRLHVRLGTESISAIAIPEVEEAAQRQLAGRRLPERSRRSYGRTGGTASWT